MQCILTLDQHKTRQQPQLDALEHTSLIWGSFYIGRRASLPCLCWHNRATSNAHLLYQVTNLVCDPLFIGGVITQTPCITLHSKKPRQFPMKWPIFHKSGPTSHLATRVSSEPKTFSKDIFGV